MRLAIDVDGVVADFVGGWSAIYEHWWPGRLDSSKLVDWDGIGTGTHFKDEDEFWTWSDDALVWDSLPVIAGCQGVLYDLHNAGHEVVFVTSRHKETQAATWNWLYAHFAFLPLEMHESNFPPVTTRLFFPGKNKHEVKADLYLDDNPEVLLDLKRWQRNTCRFVRPWNDTKYMKSAIPLSIRTWAEFPAVVEAVQEIL